MGMMGTLRKGILTRPWDPTLPDNQQAEEIPPNVMMGGPMPPEDDRPTLASRVAPDPSSAPEPAPAPAPAPVAAAPVSPVDPTRLNDLEAQRAKMRQGPSGWGGKLLQVGKVALPIAAGAAAAGLPGAALAATDELSNYQSRKRADLNEQNKEIEAERNRQNTLQGKVYDSQVQAPLRNAQTRAYDSLADQRDNTPTDAKPPSIQVMQGADGKPHAMGWNPSSKAFDLDMGVHYEHEAVPQGDEFTRLWANDPKHHDAQGNLIKPTLKDKLDYDNQHRRDTYIQPPPTFSPMTDEKGNVIGKWNSRTGQPQSLTDQVTNGTPAPTYRKGAIPGTLQRPEIQAIAIQKSEQDLSDFIDAHKNVLGPFQGREQEFLRWWGSPDPAAQEMRGKIESFAALNPALHNFRSSVWAENIVKKLGGQKLTPEALKAGIHGLATAASSMRGATEDYFKPAGSAPAAPATGKKWNIRTGRYE